MTSSRAFRERDRELMRGDDPESKQRRQKTQMCFLCDDPTGRCEDDSLFDEAGCGPFCEACYSVYADTIKENE